MMRLHSDWAYIEQEFGCSVRDHFLMAVRSLDNPRAVTPFLLEVGGRRFGLFLHVEKGNVEAARLPPDIVPVYYRPYFTFEPSERSPAVHGGLGDAVAAVAEESGSIVVDRRLPVAVADELARLFEVRIEDGADPGPVTAVAVSRAEVRSRLNRHRPAAAATARNLLAGSAIREAIEPYLQGSSDLRFESLDSHLDQAGISAVIVSSTLNVQEIGGVPVRGKRRPLAVLYPAGDTAWIIESGHHAEGRTYPSAKAALNDLCSSGTIGVECEDLDCATHRALGLDDRDTRPADNLLRRWRDRETLLDLPFYVIATRASAYAIEAALDHARHAVGEGDHITEMDAFAIYMDRLRSFVANALPQFRVARTLTNFHTGARTIFPANPAPFPLNRDANALKIDAGCLLFDAEGYLLGCSDIARTLALSEPGRELYELFRKSVCQTLIPAAAAGRSGHDMHAIGTAAIWNKRQELSVNPLFVDFDRPGPSYDRDVGHLLGKNNLAHLRFAHGDQETLVEGMIACCEYQWPFADHAIAYEDTCLVTPQGGLNLTSDVTTDHE